MPLCDFENMTCGTCKSFPDVLNHNNACETLSKLVVTVREMSYIWVSFETIGKSLLTNSKVINKYFN